MGLRTGPQCSRTALGGFLVTEMLGLVGEDLGSQLLGVQELWEAPHHGLHQAWGEDATQFGVHTGSLLGQAACPTPGAPVGPWAGHLGLLQDWGGLGQLVRLRPVLSRWKGSWWRCVVGRDAEVAGTHSPPEGWREGRGGWELSPIGVVASIRAPSSTPPQF